MGIVTVGNYSYISLNIHADIIENHAEEVLGALNTFEAAHPELEITNWQIDIRYGSYQTWPYIYGIWVSHRPKK
ncbi:MAG: hypothetical protein Q7R84_03390 [bacterium]|nr:hypothetical protein [bacterium]